MRRAGVVLVAVMICAGISLGQGKSNSSKQKAESGVNFNNFVRIFAAKVSRTGLTSSIPSTTLLTPTHDTTYRVASYIVPVTGTGSGSLSFNLDYADNGGLEEIGYYSIVAGVGCSRVTSCSYETIIRANAGAPLSYDLFISGNVTYDIFITVERLQ